MSMNCMVSGAMTRRPKATEVLILSAPCN